MVTPSSDRSTPVTTTNALPEEARKIPDNRHPDARTRADLLANCGVSALAVKLKMWVGELLQRPLSASKSSFELAGGFSSDCGRVYPVPTFSGLPPVLLCPSPAFRQRLVGRAQPVPARLCIDNRIPLYAASRSVTHRGSRYVRPRIACEISRGGVGAVEQLGNPSLPSAF